MLKIVFYVCRKSGCQVGVPKYFIKSCDWHTLVWCGSSLLEHALRPSWCHLCHQCHRRAPPSIRSMLGCQPSTVLPHHFSTLPRLQIYSIVGGLFQGSANVTSDSGTSINSVGKAEHPAGSLSSSQPPWTLQGHYMKPTPQPLT